MKSVNQSDLYEVEEALVRDRISYVNEKISNRILYSNISLRKQVDPCHAIGNIR